MVNRIIVALDTSTAEEAVRLARSLRDHVGGFKVGLRLLHGPGPGVVAALAKLGRPVFADAKLHDIPTQVAAAAHRLARHGARWITSHASGGSAMLEAAIEGAGDGAGEEGCGILAVTVLTSLEATDLAAIGVAHSPGQWTSKLAKLAAGAGAEGVVCSPLEVNVVRQAAPELTRFCPGIRPTDGGGDDQRRLATPREAVQRGADWLVIGRPIVEAEDPPAAASEIAQSLVRLN